MEEFPFRLWFPLQKSQANDGPSRMIQGIASTEDEDLQKEIVIQKGLIYEPLEKEGFINWDHLPGPENIIGEPLEVEIRPQGLWVKGFLYEGHPRADATWSLIEAMEKAGPHSKRRLGWSVEGGILSRRGNRIEKAVVRNLALTHQPINTYTYAELVKSFFGKAMSTENAQPIKLQNLDEQITSILWGDCQNDCFDKYGRYKQGRYGAIQHLVKCKGMDLETAKALVKRLATCGI